MFPQNTQRRDTSWWYEPSLKNMRSRQIYIMNPQGFGVKHSKKYLSCHHLVYTIGFTTAPMGLSVLATHLMIQLNDGWKQQSTPKGVNRKYHFQFLPRLLLVRRRLSQACLLLPGHVSNKISPTFKLWASLLQVVGVLPQKDQQVRHFLPRWTLIRHIPVSFSMRISSFLPSYQGDSDETDSVCRVEFNCLQWWQSDKIRWCLSLSGIFGSFFRSATLLSSCDAASIVAIIVKFGQRVAPPGAFAAFCAGGAFSPGTFVAVDCPSLFVHAMLPGPGK